MSYYNSEELIELENKVTKLMEENAQLVSALSSLNVATLNGCDDYSKTTLCAHVQSLLERKGDK